MDRLFIIALLDSQTSDYCHELWCEYAGEVTVAYENVESISLNPHITLATLDVPDAKEFAGESSTLFSGLPAFDVHFGEIGYYENLASVSLLPDKKGMLMDAFARATAIHPECLTKFYNEGPEVYLPHVTLFHDGHMSREKLSEIGKQLQTHFQPFTGQIKEIDYSVLLKESHFQILKRIKLR